MTDPYANQGKQSEACRQSSEYVLRDLNLWVLLALMFAIGVILS